MKLSVTSLSSQVYQILKEKIMSNEIPAGQRIVDSQVASEFGISRTPVRDALLKLCEDGLVVVNQGNKGYYVYQPVEKDIKEVFELRLFFDVSAVHKIIENGFPADQALIERFNLAYKKNLECLENDDFVQADEEFHKALIALCENERFSALYENVCAYTRIFRIHTSMLPDRVRRALELHTEIYEGLVAKDIQKTLAALNSHVEISISNAYDDLK